MRLTILFLAAAAAGPQAEVKHRFLVTDGEVHRLLYVDQFDPGNDWSATTPSGPRDLRIVEGGKVLVSHHRGAAEYDLKTGKQVWNVDRFSGVESAIRLANGNTLLGSKGGKGISLVEVDREGKEVRRAVVEGKQDNHIVQRLEGGNVLLSHNTSGKSWALEVDAEGKKVWEVQLPGYADDIDRLKNGNTLAPTGDKCTLVELDREGKAVSTLGGKDAHPKLGLHWFASAEELKNGNFMVTNWLGHRKGPAGPHLVEFDRANKVVWSWTDPGRTQSVHNSLTLE